MAALVVARGGADRARGARRAAPALLVAAGAVLGLAFEVKLFEALVAAPALAALWWLGARAARGGRARWRSAAPAPRSCAVALAWLCAVVARPRPSRPFALGSANGSAWDAVVRLRRHRPPPRERRRPARTRRRPRRSHGAPAPPGVARLLSTHASLQGRVGLEVAAAVAALALALAGGAWARLDRAGPRRPRRPRRVARVRPRARERDARPAPALPRGVRPRPSRRSSARARCSRRAGARACRSRVAFAGVIAASLVVSVRAVAAHRTDSGRPGWIPPARVAALSAFLRGHDGTATDEVATVAPSKAAQLIARDGRPVLVLASVDGRPIVTPRALAADVAAGRVRYALVGDRCVRPGTAACTPVARWVRANGVDVSAAAGQPHRGLVYRLRRTPTSARARTSSRSRAAARRSPRRASAARRRGRQARRRSRSARARA